MQNKNNVTPKNLYHLMREILKINIHQMEEIAWKITPKRDFKDRKELIVTLIDGYLNGKIDKNLELKG